MAGGKSCEATYRFPSCIFKMHEISMQFYNFIIHRNKANIVDRIMARSYTLDKVLILVAQLNK